MRGIWNKWGRARETIYFFIWPVIKRLYGGKLIGPFPVPCSYVPSVPQYWLCSSVLFVPYINLMYQSILCSKYSKEMNLLLRNIMHWLKKFCNLLIATTILCTCIHYMANCSCDKMTYELRHEISNNVACATSKVSDQPGYMLSLIRAWIFYHMSIKLLTEYHLENFSKLNMWLQS